MMILFLLLNTTERAFLCEATTVKRGDVYSFIYYYGKVTSAEQAYVFTSVPGKLIKYTVKEGEWVKKGETIALLDRDIPGVNTEPVKVNSPINGYVGILYLHKGEMVVASSPVALIYGARSLVELEVSGSVLPYIRRGAPAYIPTEHGEIKGFVSSVSSALDPRTGMGKVKVSAGGGLVIGDMVPVKIVKKRARNVLYVPDKSLVEREGRYYVFKLLKGKVKQIEVKKGVEGEDIVEIEGNIAEGDTVITTGAFGLYNGARVKLQEKER